eukprot:gene43741-biopygen29905
MVLETGLEAEIFAGGGNIAERGGDFPELVGGGALEVVAPRAEAEAPDAVFGQGAEGGLGVWLGEAGDVGRGEMEIEAAAAEGGGEHGEEIGHTLYGATKAYMIRFSQSLHVELAGDGVHVTALCPGLTYSEFHDVNGTRAQYSASIPTWMWQGADEVAATG